MSYIQDAKNLVDLAENSVDLKARSEYYRNAAKLYLRVASNVSDDYVKRSLIYLSTSCANKANLVAQTSSDVPKAATIKEEGDKRLEAALVLESQRLIQQAHLNRLKRIEKV
jgi:hypothetical protein